MKIAASTAAGIYDDIRARVLSGELRDGTALPPVRELAVTLGLNRNTVAAAYKRLVAAGLAVAQGRNGTVIRAQLAPLEHEGRLAGSPLIDLASGNPSPQWLPDPRDLVATLSGTPRLYGEPTIDPAFESQARAWLGDDPPDGYALDLAHGAVDAIERLLAAWLVPGDKVAVEDPCFLGSLNTLRAAGLTARGVPVDGEGMRAEALEAVLAEGVQAVVCTPRAHNPTGCSISARRAKALRAVLARHPHVLVIEDDHFSALAAHPYRSLIGATTRRWALVRSLSKCFGPDLRVALVASDAQTSQRLRLRLGPGTVWVSHLLQDMTRGLLTSKAIRTRIGRARDDYARRRATLARALRERGIAADDDGDGLNVWVPLAIDGDEAARRLARHGWLVRPGRVFAVEQVRHAIRVTVSTLDDAGAASFAADLRRCLDAG